ncbi:MAG: hypothetical protein HYZ91_05550 [Candidatus Omnitrophica bacterium]|nr:hypothetical protein [Candidatus Omnitrophota bacterium]
MKLDFAFLADAANVSQGKFYVLGGGFDRILAPSVPATHSYMTLLMRFALEPSELEKPHNLEVRLLDADGRKVHVVQNEFIARRQSESESWRPHGHIFTLNLVTAKFEAFGDYSLEIFVDGSHLGNVPLSVSPANQQPVGR